MPIEAQEIHKVIVKEDGDQYRWYVYDGNSVFKVGDLYDTYNIASGKGYYWLRTEWGEGRI